MAQSLADVARQEAARRQQVAKTGKVLTNADLPASAVVAPPGAPSAAAATDTADGAATPAAGDTAAAGTAESAAAAKPAPKEGAPAASKAAAAPTDDEAGWRARADRINTALAAAHAQVRQLKALSDRLSLESQASNPAIAARAQAERTELRAQITQAEEKQAAAQSERDAFVQEARVAGVPPGVDPVDWRRLTDCPRGSETSVLVNAGEPPVATSMAASRETPDVLLVDDNEDLRYVLADGAVAARLPCRRGRRRAVGDRVPPAPSAVTGPVGPAPAAGRWSRRAACRQGTRPGPAGPADDRVTARSRRPWRRCARAHSTTCPSPSITSTSS